MKFPTRSRIGGRLAPLAILLGTFAGWTFPTAWADEPAPGVEIDLQTRWIAGCRLNSSGATVAQSSPSLDLTVPLAGSAASGLQLEIVAERPTFQFQDFGAFLAGRPAPLGTASLLTIQPTLLLAVDRGWSVVGVMTAQSAGADGARFNQTILLGGSAAALYQEGKNAKFGLGVSLDPRLQGSARIFPFPLIDWRLSEEWSLTSLDGQSGQISFGVARSVRLFGKLEFQTKDIRLAPSSSIPSGILRYEAFPLSLGIEWRPATHLSVSVSAGWALAQSYRFLDRPGGLLQSSSVRSPALGSLELDYSF